MLVKKKSHIVTEGGVPNLYLVTIVNEKHVSWDFCMRILMDVFYKNVEEAKTITNDILTCGEGICGGYLLEIAESKALIVEKHAKRERFSLCCILEEM
jgi:ATP-dependent Clp protease adaptor protein ClpS